MPLTEQAQAFLDAIAEANPPQWHEMSPHEARETFDTFEELFGEGPEIHRVEDRTIDGDFPVRIFSDSESDAPVVMYFHGGGWVLGNVRTHDALCRRLAKQSGCVVVSVDYGLSPENRFPGPLEDCFRATRHVANNPGEFGANGKLAVAGDSAGGNLAATVSLQARDQDGPKIDLQVLIYPVIEPSCQTSSYQQFAEGYGLTLGSMQWFWDNYLGQQTITELAAPSRADNLSGLPPAHVITAEYDVLRDEGEAFAQMLEQAGVPTTLRRYDGNLHGFVHFAGAFDDGLRATSDVADVLRSKLID